MDNLRWILLVVGVFFVFIVYFISKKKKKADDYYDYEDIEDMPDISTDNWDDLDEGVGEVRIVARDHERDHENTYDDYSEESSDDQYIAEAEPAYQEPAAEYDAVEEPVAVEEKALEEEARPASTKQEAPDEAVIVLNILAREGANLPGKSINSVLHANNMVFGDMNIYHRLDDNQQPVFSLINMIKPGSFDPTTMHELKTPGISLFMQLPGPRNPSAAFTDMLQTAYRISETLEARLCDKYRQPLTESIADEYRDLVASFDGR
jgi:cell division protein ZipA